LIPNPKNKVEKFKEGLHPKVRERVACLWIKEFTNLVEVATIAGGEIRSAITAAKRRKRQMSQSSQLKKMIVFNNNPD